MSERYEWTDTQYSERHVAVRDKDGEAYFAEIRLDGRGDGPPDYSAGADELLRLVVAADDLRAQLAETQAENARLRSEVDGLRLLATDGGASGRWP